MINESSVHLEGGIVGEGLMKVVFTWKGGIVGE